MSDNQSLKGKLFMLPALISLWKKEGSKWYRYNSTFATTSKMQMQKAARLIRSGWLPYNDVKRVTDNTTPLPVDVFDIPTTELDEIVLSQTPICRHIPSDWYERLLESLQKASQEKNEEPPIIIEQVSEDLTAKVLKKAIEDFKAGKPIPPYLVKDVMSRLFAKTSD